MRNFQDTFEIHKRSFVSAFSICMTVPSISQKKELFKINLNGERHKDQPRLNMRTNSCSS